MKSIHVCRVLASSIASIVICSASLGETAPTGAKPITTAATVGNEQSDFFYVKGAFDHHTAGKNMIVFSSSVGLAKKTVKKVSSYVADKRVLFSQEVNSVLGEPNFTVTKAGPLKKVTTLAIPLPAPIADPKGSTPPVDPEITPLDSFVYNSDDESIDLIGKGALPSQLFFHAPGKGIYVIKNGASAGIVRAETATAPTVPGALKNPGSRYDNTDSEKTLQSRYVFGALVPTKNKMGYEPFVSAGGAAATLDDIETGENLGSNPYDFTTFGDADDGNLYKTVYFLTNPDDGATTTPSLWRLTVHSEGKKLIYSATQAAGQTNLTSPHFPAGDGGPVFPSSSDPTYPHLATDGAFLFLSKKASPADSFNSLYISPDIRDIQNAQFTFESNPVSLQSGGNVVDASDFAPKPVNENITAFVSTEHSSGHRLFTAYFATADSAAFTDGTGSILNPTSIVGAESGEEFFYIATRNGIQYAIGDDTLNSSNTSNLTGGASPNALTDQSGALLTNIKELVNIGDIIFLVADGKVSGDPVADALWKYDAGNLDSGDYQAEPVLSETGSAPVIGAHNLGGFAESAGVSDRRLYFTAPIDSTHNSEYRPLDKHRNPIDAGTKPWVYEF
jgi:hypothetical protein